MASRFWVGGTGTWDNASTAHWAASTGGASGASIPTSSDDVFFDANSGGGTVTINYTGGAPCQNLDFTGFAGTVASTTNTLPTGNVILGTGGTFTSFFLQMNPPLVTTRTITSNSKTLNALDIAAQGAGTGGVQVADALTVTNAITLTRGTFDTNGQTVQSGSFVSSNVNNRTLTLGATSWTVTGNGNPAWDTSINTNMTFNKGTSTLTFSAAAKIVMNLSSYNNVIVNSAACFMTGGTTFANFTLNGVAVKNATLDFDSNWTVTGTLSILANSAINRILFRSHIGNVQITVTAATLTCTGVVDFQDVKGAGTATWSAAASGATAFGDAGGNSGITLDASVTQAWQGTSGGNWSDVTKWTSRVPLPQDDVSFPVAFSAAQTIVMDMPRIGRSIDFSGCSGSPTLQYGAFNMINYGSWNFIGIGSITTGGNATSIRMNARAGTWSLTTGGTSLPGGAGNDVNIQIIGGTLNLQDTLSWNCTFVFTGGTFNTNNNNMSAYGFQFNAGMACTVNCGSSVLNVIGSTGMWQVTGGVTFNCGTSKITYTNNPGSNAQQFQGGGFTYNIVEYKNAGTGGFTITGSNIFSILDIEASASRTVTWTAGTTQTVNKLFVLRADGGFTLSNVSSSPGTGYTITLGSTALPQLWNHSLTDATINYPAKIRFWVGGAGTWDATTTHWSSTSGGSSGATAPDSTTVVVFDANSGLTSNQIVSINPNVPCGGLAVGGISGRAVQLRFNSAGMTFSAGNYSFMGYDEWSPIWIKSSSTGNTCTVTCNGTHTVHRWVHFMDIAWAGTSGTLSGTLIGDALGNSGITFEPAVICNANGTTSFNWSDSTRWSPRVPLPQDTAKIALGFAASQTITLDEQHLAKDIDFTGTTGGPAFSKSGTSGGQAINPWVFGSLTSAGSVTFPGNNTFFFGGRGQHTWTPMFMGWGFTVDFQAPGGTYKMMGHMLNSASGTFTLEAGTWDWNGYNVNIRSAGGVTNLGGQTARLVIGSGTHRLGGNAVASQLNLNGSGVTLDGTGGGTIIFQSTGRNFICQSPMSASQFDLSNTTLIFQDESPTGASMNLTMTPSSSPVRVKAIIFRGPNRGNFEIQAFSLVCDTLDVEASGTLSFSGLQSYQFKNLILRGWAAPNELSGPGLSVVSNSPGNAVTVTVTGILETSNVTFSNDIHLSQTGNAGYQKSPNDFDFLGSGYDFVQQNVSAFNQGLQTLYFFTGEVYQGLMAPIKTTWDMDYWNGLDPVGFLQRYGLAYLEANAIRSVTNVGLSELHTTFDANTIRSKTTPVGVDIAQFLDAATIRTLSKFTISDLSIFADSAAIRSKATPVIFEITQFVEAVFARSSSKLTIADIQDIHDRATIRAITTVLGSDLHTTFDAATIRAISALTIIKLMPPALLSALVYGRWSSGESYGRWSASCKDTL